MSVVNISYERAEIMANRSVTIMSDTVAPRSFASQLRKERRDPESSDDDLICFWMASITHHDAEQARVPPRVGWPEMHAYPGSAQSNHGPEHFESNHPGILVRRPPIQEGR